MAPTALLDQQTVALTTGMAARAAVAQVALAREHRSDFIAGVTPATTIHAIRFRPAAIAPGAGLHASASLTMTVRGALSSPEAIQARRYGAQAYGSGRYGLAEGSFDEPQRRELVSQVAAIRDLIQSEHIATARKLMEMIPVTTTEEAALVKLRRALAPPSVRPSARKDMTRTQAYAWLRQNASQYKGQWVAVNEQGLIAAAPTLKQLCEQLAVLPLNQAPLLHKL